MLEMSSDKFNFCIFSKILKFIPNKFKCINYEFPFSYKNIKNIIILKLNI